MPPKKIERRICAYTFDTLRLFSERNIKDWADLRSQPEFMQMLGYFSHAYHIGYFGLMRTRGTRTDRLYAFSREMTHAWEAVLTQYQNILPEDFQKSIFVVGR